MFLRSVGWAFPVLTVALLTAFPALSERDDSAEVQTIASDHLWRVSLEIGKSPDWVEGSREMKIAPPKFGNGFRAPANLSAASRELDIMLPKNYAEAAAKRSPGKRCLVVASKELYVLHEALIGFIYENWLDNDRAAFSSYAYRLMNIPPPPDQVLRTEEFTDIAAWTLCSYYNRKRAGTVENAREVVAPLREEILRLRARDHEG
jgi:hypothetical protein